MRSAVVLGGESTRSPATHVECFVQEACPASGWKVSIGHGSHFSAFFVPEAVPAAHGRQPRSAVAVGCVTACSPFAHTECGRQNPLPSNAW